MRNGNQNAEKGFTLVEVLVAMLIFSTAILGLLKAGTENIRAVNYIEDKLVAGIIADNQLILAQINKDIITPGKKQDFVKMAGRIWQWEIKTEKTSQTGFYKMTIDVRPEGVDQIIVKRTAFTQGRP
ncbi:MAG: type II secretion system minor pseudopilin GspI [Robiginitomaculum sp.]|nr:type II secretion system minor pseudopilin GspI [Robiginitomaculum sp.]